MLSVPNPGLGSMFNKCRKGKESEVAQLFLTLCNPMDCSPPGSSVHGIFQARVLEWVAIALTQGSNPGFQHCIQTLYRLSHQGSLNKCRDTTNNPMLVGKRNKNQQNKVNRLFNLKEKLIISNEKATFLFPLSLLKFSSEEIFFPCPWMKTSITLC